MHPLPTYVLRPDPRGVSEARLLNRRSRIFLKLDHLQPGGSFKSRGIGNLVVSSLKRADKPQNVHFYSSSGGNAGLACVHAANFVGRPSTVVVPMSTKPMMIAKIRAAGASEVLQEGASIREADAYLKEVVMVEAAQRGEEPVYVPPFDHPDIWAGNSTLVDELRTQFQELGEGVPDVIACSVGGGGLLNGIVQSCEALGGAWDGVLALGVETHGADSLAKAMEAREHITLPGITSLATSLGCSKVSERTFDIATNGLISGRVKNVVLSDAEAAMGCWRFADDERVLVELACGVTLALCYGGRLERALGRPVHPEEKIVIVVCGGQNVTTEMVEGWREEYGSLDREASMTKKRVESVPSKVTAPIPITPPLTPPNGSAVWLSN